MPKFKENHRVKILKHTNPKNCGREGTVAAAPIKVEVGTAGVVEGGTFLPPGKPQWIYQVEIDDSSSERVQCQEDWLEAL